MAKPNGKGLCKLYMCSEKSSIIKILDLTFLFLSALSMLFPDLPLSLNFAPGGLQNVSCTLMLSLFMIIYFFGMKI